MATELEVKAVVPDPVLLRAVLFKAGAVLRFHGMMRDRRFDRDNTLTLRDEVLRVRLWSAAESDTESAELAWKGPTTRSAAGHKQREEIECHVDHGPTVVQLLRALEYAVTEEIDRYVEVYEVDTTVARLEWYPRMDVLIEIEGTADGIERLTRDLGLPRDAYRADSLIQFAARYTERTGHSAVLSQAGLAGAEPGWSTA